MLQVEERKIISRISRMLGSKKLECDEYRILTNWEIKQEGNREGNI